uniref:Uncharacterized protein n=1 Tax=Avena sativa TaxID=4498 RepID=A0ACD5WTT0_AVESA
MPMCTESPPSMCIFEDIDQEMPLFLLESRHLNSNGSGVQIGDPKNGCLKQQDKAPENLNLLKADMLDYDAVRAAFSGCQGVFHVASPVPIDKMVDKEASKRGCQGVFHVASPVPIDKMVDKEREMMAPTVNGTKNVLKACSATSVQKLIVVSSGAAVTLNPNWPQDKLKDESCWSDKESCKENEIWYAVAKLEAEEMALEYAEKSGLHVVTFCPGAVFGPLLQSDVLNITTKFLRYIIKGGPDTINNKFWPIVDVRDVADALLLLYHKAGSSQRYICSQHQVDIKDLIELMKSMYPHHGYADKLVDVDYKLAMSSDKLKNLGWKARTLEETLQIAWSPMRNRVSSRIRMGNLVGFHISTVCRLLQTECTLLLTCC